MQERRWQFCVRYPLCVSRLTSLQHLKSNSSLSLVVGQTRKRTEWWLERKPPQLEAFRCETSTRRRSNFSEVATQGAAARACAPLQCYRRNCRRILLLPLREPLRHTRCVGHALLPSRICQRNCPGCLQTRRLPRKEKPQHQSSSTTSALNGRMILPPISLSPPLGSRRALCFSLTRELAWHCPARSHDAEWQLRNSAAAVSSLPLPRSNAHAAVCSASLIIFCIGSRTSSGFDELVGKT